MKMEIFEFGVYIKEELVAGFNDIGKANLYAFEICKNEHCDVNVINAFTGEVHLSLVCYVHIIYNDEFEELKRIYEVKEKEW